MNAVDSRMGLATKLLLVAAGLELVFIALVVYCDAHLGPHSVFGSLEVIAQIAGIGLSNWLGSVLGLSDGLPKLAFYSVIYVTQTVVYWAGLVAVTFVFRRDL